MGIAVGSGVTDISDNSVENFRYGVRTQQQLGGSFSSLVATVDSNAISGVTVQGIGIGGVTGVQQAGGTFTNNVIDATGATSNPGGVVISNAGNTVSANSLTDFGRGVTIVLCKKFDTTNNTVDDNDFDNAPLVVAVSTDGGQCATGSGGDTEGVGSWVTDGGTFDGFNANGNSFSNGIVGFASSSSSGFSANKPVTAGPLDITCNFWDDATGPDPSPATRPVPAKSSPSARSTASPTTTTTRGRSPTTVPAPGSVEHPDGRHGRRRGPPA